MSVCPICIKTKLEIRQWREVDEAVVVVDVQRDIFYDACSLYVWMTAQLETGSTPTFPHNREPINRDASNCITDATMAALRHARSKDAAMPSEGASAST